MKTEEEKSKRKKEYMAKWSKENKEKLRGYYKKRHKEKKDEILKYQREYYKKNKEVLAERRRKIRLTFFEMYGKECFCCGISDYEFLTLDHILGQKGKKRESVFTAYKSAIKEYRPDLYRVLCWNCNCSIGTFGYCPHEKF